MVAELPADFRDAVTDNKPVKSSPTPVSFKLSGKDKSFAQGFFEATSSPQTYEEFLS